MSKRMSAMPPPHPREDGDSCLSAIPVSPTEIQNRHFLWATHRLSRLESAATSAMPPKRQRLFSPPRSTYPHPPRSCPSHPSLSPMTWKWHPIFFNLPNFFIDFPLHDPIKSSSRQTFYGATMNFDLLVTIGVIFVAGIYLASRFRKKSGGCCGCSGCSGEIQPKPGDSCPSRKG